MNIWLLLLLTFHNTLDASDLCHLSWLVKNIVPLASQEQCHAWIILCSVYSSEDLQSQDLVEVILKNRTICIPHGDYHQLIIFRGPQGLKLIHHVVLLRRR